MKKSMPASVVVPGSAEAAVSQRRQNVRGRLASVYRVLLALSGLSAVLWSAPDAMAACSPVSGLVTPGTIVICTGTTTNQDSPFGYGTGAETGITINLQQPNPTVSGDAEGIVIGDGTVNVPVSGLVTSPGIGLQATSGALTLNNADTVSGTGPIGSGSIGVAGSTLNIVNAATGTISGGDYGIFGQDNGTIINAGTVSGATAILLGDGNTVSNSGHIITNTGGAGFGAGMAAGSNNTIINSGTILPDDHSYGVLLRADNNSVTNNGLIAGNIIVGVELTTGTHNLVTNNGAILAGNDSAGIDGASGAFNTIVNNGTIVTGSVATFFSAGIAAGFRDSVTNNGAIIVGNDGFGIVSFSGRATIVNNGTIIAGAGILDYSAGIDVSESSLNKVTNNGLIVVGANGIGINTGDSNTITNNGTIVAGDNGISIGHCVCVVSTNNTVTNNGTLDGRLYLDSGGGTGNIFVNNGLITITDPGTPVGANHLIDGTFTQSANGTLALRVNNAGVSDFLSNSGAGTLTATLGGKLGAVVQPGLYANSTTYIGVLSATNPITTQFAHVLPYAAGTTTPLVFFTATATYNATSVDLTLNRIGFGSVPGETRNERSVGTVLNAVYSTGLTGNQALFFSNLLQATSVGALDQISGEGTSGTQETAFGAAGTFLTTMMDQGSFWLSGDTADTNGTPFTAMNYAPSLAQTPVFKAMPGATPIFEQRWRAWATGFDAATSLNGELSTGSAGLNYRTAGGVAGFDVQVTPDLLLGAAAGGSSSNFSVGDRATSGSLAGAHVGAYGVIRSGPWYGEGALGFANFDTRTTRTVAGVGPAEILNGRFDSNLFNGRFEGGYRQHFGSVAVTPFAAIEFAELWQPGYVETNPTFGGAPLGLFALNYAAKTVSSLPTFLGIQFDTHVDLPEGMLISPYLRVSWVHEFEPTRDINATFIALPGSDFTVDGPRAAADAARINAGFKLTVAHNISVFASVTGEFSDRSDMYAGKGGLKIYW